MWISPLCSLSMCAGITNPPRAYLSSIFEPQGCGGLEAAAALLTNKIACCIDNVLRTEALHIVVERYYGIVDDPLPRFQGRLCIENA